MSNLYIAEFSNTQQAARGQLMQIPAVPPLAGEVLAFTTTAQSSAFDASTAFIRVAPDSNCHLEFGVNPTATTGSVIRMEAGQVEYFGVIPGQKVAAIDA